MRKAAGIILITLGALFVWGLIDILATFYIMSNSPLMVFIPPPSFVLLLGLVAAAAFLITGGIFCLSEQYWGVCLASASFAVFFVVFNIVYLLDLYPFYWESSLSYYIYTGWPIWFMLAGAVISVILISYRRKEWQEISDSVDSKVSNGG
jgi:riboflavin transporter FmnP